MGFYGLEHPNPNAPQGTYPRRGGAKLSGTCIVHTAESVLDNLGPDSGAEDCAAFICRRSDYGSYHSLVDSDSIIEIFPYEWEAWQDSETNNWAVGISAACRTTDWATMSEAKREGYYRNLAIVAADFVTYMRTKGIEVPRRRITGLQARLRVPGFCAHGDSGVHRSDPGRDFNWNLFFKYTDEVLSGVVMANDFHPEKEWYNAMIAAQARIDARTHFIKGDGKDETVYDIEGGKLRPLTYGEWVLWAAARHPVQIVPQKDIDRFKSELESREK